MYLVIYTNLEKGGSIFLKNDIFFNCENAEFESDKALCNFFQF